MRACLFPAVLGAVVALAGGASADTLRIADINGVTEPCKALPATAPAGQKAYFQLLKQRLGREILTCGFADRAAAARAVGAGEVDLARLDPASFPPVAETARAILTLRPEGALNRIPIVLAAKATATEADLAAFKGKAVIFPGSDRAALEVPRRALADQGAGPGFFSKEEIAPNGDAAAARLRSGAVQGLAINAAAWQRVCQGDRPQDDKCKDLKVVWRGRPRAVEALVIPRSMPNELRYRLIGIHVAMHLEARDAFAWASSWMPKAAEFEATEALALAATGR